MVRTIAYLGSVGSQTSISSDGGLGESLSACDGSGIGPTTDIDVDAPTVIQAKSSICTGQAVVAGVDFTQIQTEGCQVCLVGQTNGVIQCYPITSATSNGVINFPMPNTDQHLPGNVGVQIRCGSQVIFPSQGTCVPGPTYDTHFCPYADGIYKPCGGGQTSSNSTNGAPSHAQAGYNHPSPKDPVDWDAGSTYQPGDFVLYNNVLYINVGIDNTTTPMNGQNGWWVISEFKDNILYGMGTWVYVCNEGCSTATVYIVTNQYVEGATPPGIGFQLYTP